LAPVSIDAAQAQQSATEEEAYGVDAYLYFYSLVTMDITRRQISNIEPGKGFGGPMNSFVNVPEYPPANLQTVVRPNFDTLYSSGWLDLTKEPMVVSVPDTQRPLLPIADARHVDGCVRLAGLAHNRYRGWQFRCGSARVAARFERSAYRGIQAPERHPAHRRSDALCLDHRLSQWGKAPEPVQVKIDPTIDMKTPPKIQADTMPADKFFAYAAELMKVNPFVSLLLPPTFRA